MTDEANYGLMLWDGESRGTLTSIVDLVAGGKPVAVYFSPTKTFYTLRDFSELELLLRHVDPSILLQVHPQLDSVAKGGLAVPKRETARLF